MLEVACVLGAVIVSIVVSVLIIQGASRVFVKCKRCGGNLDWETIDKGNFAVVHTICRSCGNRRVDAVFGDY